jgi:hypothetical protein
MDLHVGQLRSTVRAADSRALLDPRVLDEIVAAVLERVQAEQRRDERMRRGLRFPGFSEPDGEA